MNKINVSEKQIKSLSINASKVLVSPNDEKHLIELIKLQEQIEEAISEAKKDLEAKALELDPNFSTFKSDNLRISYRSYGAKYIVDESQINELPTDFYSVKKSYSVNTNEVDKFVKNAGAYPNGIIIANRPRTISISLNKKNE
jgi:hypothetical protein